MPTMCPTPVASEERTYVRNVHAPHAVRRFVRAKLAAWGLEHLIENTELVASELATNAVQAARGDEIAVRLERSGGAVLVKVWDDTPEPPVQRSPGIDAESGRGLMITAALSDHWGCFRVAGGGKAVWAIITKGE
jgi:anti-sigma regulatory factor (Ser/Thr protein kinase)